MVWLSDATDRRMIGARRVGPQQREPV